jgi:hypothetical protein
MGNRETGSGGGNMANLIDCLEDNCPDCQKGKRIEELRDKSNPTKDDKEELIRLSNELLGVV